MTAQIINIQDWKYGKIAKEFLRIRKTDPQAAARYAQEQVKEEEYEELSKHIQSEIMRNKEPENA